MPKILAILALILLLGAAAAWLFLPPDALDISADTAAPVEAVPPPVTHHPLVREAPVPDEFPRETAADPVAPANEIEPAPAELSGSDAAVLAAIERLNPQVAQWLLPDEQVRKWVAAINLLAEGKIPVKDRPLQVALPPFQVIQNGEQLTLDRDNYARATAVINAITQIPPSRLAQHYKAWRPLLEQAQAELGNGMRFHERLHTAIERALSVQPLTGSIELEAGVMRYTYTDPQREQASALEKALWRLGPTNILRIQQYLRDLQPLL